MIGDLLAKARKSLGMTKTELSNVTDINIGHLTHIEKGERNPSHKALKSICDALNIPYVPIMFTYDKAINEEQKKYNAINYISYNKIMAFDGVADFIDCPTSNLNAAFAIKMKDDSMAPTFEKNSYVFVELNTPLTTKEYGLFKYNNSVIIRKFFNKNEKIFLRADNKKYPEIRVSKDDEFYIIGKILKNN